MKLWSKLGVELLVLVVLEPWDKQAGNEQYRMDIEGNLESRGLLFSKYSELD